MKVSKYKTEIGIISLALFCVATSFFVAILESDWSWLERSGSLVVIVALSSFWRFSLDKRKELYESLLDYRDQVETNRRQLLEGKGVPCVELEVNESVVKQSIKDVEEKYQRLTKIEIILGAIGTLIWGYASPTLDFLAPFQ